MIFIKPINKFKTYKYDSAPFFFFIDVFPADYSNVSKPNLVSLVNSIKNNPIMPLPMRIDRVFNGERSVLIRPQEPISFPVTEDLTAIVNPIPFLQLGFEKLLYFTEVRSRENLLSSLTIQRVSRWWEATQYLYGNLRSLEEDFSAFLRAYLYTMIKAKILEEDLTAAAQNYCTLIADISRKRLEQNSILVEVKGKEEYAKMYLTKELTYYKKFKKTTETQHRPELIDIELFDLSQKGFVKGEGKDSILKGDSKTEILKYIPLLLYDDLLECMLQNLKRLEESDGEILDPSLLFERNIIFTRKVSELEEINFENYSWWNSFDTLEFDSILKSIVAHHEEYMLTLGNELLK